MYAASERMLIISVLHVYICMYVCTVNAFVVREGKLIFSHAVMGAAISSHRASSVIYYTYAVLC